MTVRDFSNIAVANAKLPQTYQAAQAALAECSRIDECKDWADKASALGSYARQAGDEQLYNMAVRIRARAIRRAGELMKQIEPDKGGYSENYAKECDHPSTRKSAARDAGMSEHQQKTAIRVANIPEDDFETQVEGDKPPTVSKLAKQGTKKREPLIDLKGRDPKEFNRALHYVGGFEFAARTLGKQDHDQILPTLNEREREKLRAAIKELDAINDKVITRI